MFRYLVIMSDRSGQWQSGPTNRAYAFNAKDDQEAMAIISAKANLRTNGVIFFGRITGGLQVQEIQFEEGQGSYPALRSGQEIGFENVRFEKEMISQLQPFSLQAGD
jgi:hypothetical protein